MSPLRQKMSDAMRMRGLSVRTQRSYVESVAGLARYYRRCPSRLGRGEVEAYFKYLVLERALSPSTCRVHFHGVRFLYEQVLGWSALAWNVTLPKRPQRIPELLTRTEVARIIAHAANPKHRALLQTCYGCGLRVSEAVGLQVRDIDSERKQLRVEQGKGSKDRMVLLSEGMVLALRAYWQLYRPSSWLFSAACPTEPMKVRTAQRAFDTAKRRAGVDKVGGIHSLRHAYATHQLEGGLAVHVLQKMLGHRGLDTTMRYVHWVPRYHDGGERHGDLLGALEVL